MGRLGRRGARGNAMEHSDPVPCRKSTMQRGSARKRERIFRRDDWTCVYCGTAGTEAELTVDHVEPRVKGGDGSDGNLVTSCRACNARKGGEAAWSFLSRHMDLRESFLRRATEVWPRLRRAVEEAAG